MVSAGCFLGSVADFKKAVVSKYANPESDYYSAIRFIEELLITRKPKQ